ncbi:hypothetical protein A3F00_02775 [Candidatus Daviesbacteria bacterium RIFCSPHIGHO2_12_FULL_37_11]|uniref:tRNA uridine(34) hydroxylase n=1 Tax=Candidatus Daviesbacteria bacterium RIFCSPHIGHO2_12_FULL_37_11 TaxID=1797777 RepID=A0A1F5K982_9BACT|nr:MAG: hypothetical protein A2769_01920 [Candidatus Daviesbacteria bacterium RIFCSPHIGHO2_01_FULL_37_27]OGE37375.1 MAG: hypothetical protein A3F00_02775 [Candidatus Daviesbacteria bacterium RIFCSPHIGHO2_12_FULL_37_11]OGE45541.1 MAG: hypothetical protein A3B39_05010 [Candidatus Daviesbacteria bacterium RIFCSPLOWO2_01_FULL_37_10]
MNSRFNVLLFYKYTKISDPEEFRVEHLKLCEKLKLKGRIIIASEGINGTVEGTIKNTEKYIKTLTKDERFSDIHFKKSIGDGKAFPKLSIKVREEIVSAHLNNDKNPKKLTGNYITPEQLHGLIHSEKKFFIIDMRNDFEHAVGYFKNSILAPFKNFRDLPMVLPVLDSLKNETIITVCTGGVRCEKASGFLIQSGFREVYQLFGGIVSYMEKYPNEDFLGTLYTFDGRVTMGFNLAAPEHVIVGKCKFCKGSAEKYYDCKNIHCKRKRHFISCDKCIDKNIGFCNQICQKSSNLESILQPSSRIYFGI